MLQRLPGLRSTPATFVPLSHAKSRAIFATGDVEAPFRTNAPAASVAPVRRTGSPLRTPLKLARTATPAAGLPSVVTQTTRISGITAPFFLSFADVTTSE